MKAEIITTGTELLLGEIVDTNATFIARQLRSLGVNLYYKTTVGDNRQRLSEVIRLGLSRSEVLVITGGLGPTVDDITREAVADATDTTLIHVPEIEENLRQMFGRWGRPLTENNLRQAFLPANARMIPNPIGTAPGFVVEVDEGIVICMPGVPREMKHMMSSWVLPYLQGRLGNEAGVIVTRVIHTAGIGESTIDDLIAPMMMGGNPTVGLAAHLGRVDIRLGARATTAEDARALIEPLESEIRSRLDPWIYGFDEDTLGSVVAQLLRRRQSSIAIAESNTDGVVAEQIADADAGVVSRAERIDEWPGADSQILINASSAERLAQDLLHASDAAIALVLLGSREPDQGIWGVSRGQTWLALAEGERVESKSFDVGGSDEYTSNWLAVQGLNQLRLYLLS